MTYCVSSAADLTDMIVKEISSLQRLKNSGAMLIIPIYGVDSDVAVATAIRDVPGFAPWADADPTNIIGYFRYTAVRTVADALRELQTNSVDVGELLALNECSAPTHVEGKTVRINTMFGPLIVDKAKFAAHTGLPLTAPQKELTVFAYEVPERVYSQDTRRVLVAIPDTPKSQLPTSGNDNLSALFPLLKERAKNGFETSVSFDVKGLNDGWQLQSHPLFVELLGSLRLGYGYALQKLESGGLNIPY